MQVLRLDNLLPAPQTGTALLCCLGEVPCMHSKVLQLVRDRVNYPTLVTLGPALLPEVGARGEGGLSLLPTPPRDRQWDSLCSQGHLQINLLHYVFITWMHLCAVTM